MWSGAGKYWWCRQQSPGEHTCLLPRAHYHPAAGAFLPRLVGCVGFLRCPTARVAVTSFVCCGVSFCTSAWPWEPAERAPRAQPTQHTPTQHTPRRCGPPRAVCVPGKWALGLPQADCRRTWPLTPLDAGLAGSRPTATSSERSRYCQPVFETPDSICNRAFLFLVFQPNSPKLEFGNLS